LPFLLFLALAFFDSTLDGDISSAMPLHELPVADSPAFNCFQIKLKAYSKSFVHRWLNTANEGLDVYEQNDATHYKNYQALRRLCNELYLADCRFQVCQLLGPESMNGSPLLAFDLKAWPLLLRTPVRFGASESIKIIKRQFSVLIGELEAIKRLLLCIKEFLEFSGSATEEEVRRMLDIEFSEVDEVHLHLQILKRFHEGLLNNKDHRSDR
jgi:hypothetical protein